MDTTDVVSMIVRWIHVAAAITAIGGAAFMRWALLPAVQTALPADLQSLVHDAVRGRWTRVVHVCIALLLVTGAINFYLLALKNKIDPMPYHALFGLKVLSALGVFFIASALGGRAPGFARMRADRGKWLSILLALAAVIVLLSGGLNMIRATSLQPQASTPVPATAWLDVPPDPTRHL